MLVVVDEQSQGQLKTCDHLQVHSWCGMRCRHYYYLWRFCLPIHLCTPYPTDGYSHWLQNLNGGLVIGKNHYWLEIPLAIASISVWNTPVYMRIKEYFGFDSADHRWFIGNEYLIVTPHHIVGFPPELSKFSFRDSWVDANIPYRCNTSYQRNTFPSVLLSYILDDWRSNKYRGLTINCMCC